MDSATRAYIEGHVPPTVGEEYGEYETVALKHEIGAATGGSGQPP